MDWVRWEVPSFGCVCEKELRRRWDDGFAFGGVTTAIEEGWKPDLMKRKPRSDEEKIPER